MSDNRVAITGLGVISPVGLGIESFWKALIAGTCNVKTIDQFDPGKFPCRVASRIDDFSARKFVPKHYRKAVKVMARDIEIAVAAADFAFRDSGIITRGIDTENLNIDAKRLGCNIGAGLICSDLNELGAAINTAVVDGKFDLKAWGEHGINNLTPLWLLKYLPNMLSCHVTIIHDAEGPSNTITCGDASGHMAIGEASRYVAQGRADVAIAGGAESKLNPMGLLRQNLMDRLCTTSNDSPENACRPFDSAHAGTVIGEGGGLVILENLARAEARGAKIYAELVGFAGACDPNGVEINSPTAGNMQLAAINAMADAGISSRNVGLAVAHGTGVPGEDAAESAGWSQALADAEAKVPAFAITGAMGSMFAGAGAVELVAAAMALHTQTVPQTVNFDTPADSECPLSFASETRQTEINYAVTASFTVGGQSGACVLKKYQA